MRSFKILFLTSILSSFSLTVFANNSCCRHMGGTNYCDSSTGRLVCNNGFYSACYCTRHAVMDLQLLKGCCLWHGGVMPVIDPSGLVICNDSSISEECTAQDPPERIAAW